MKVSSEQTIIIQSMLYRLEFNFKFILYFLFKSALQNCKPLRITINGIS